MTTALTPSSDFGELALAEPVIKALNDVGYESPSPIQAATIPHILSGRDVLGQAQTGTGKTAAFALPLLSRIVLELLKPQVLVLAPTRELAIQVAEAFQRYAAHLQGFHVLPVYGGTDYSAQLRQLKRGVHVVVGTPGRVMDHMRRQSLQLNELRCLVLDEADEMLRMGFIDDVEWILEYVPAERQIALFSATLPAVIRQIAQKHLTDPVEITIKVGPATAEVIRQRYWMVSGFHKLDALTRILEAETFDGMIIFVRTKNATVELAGKLEARGYASAPLNGDIAQKQRENTIERLKSGKLDILVATDVAARGLDVDRVSHVINYDIPYDTEAYIHRIGRTGRFGREGETIMFVAPRERRLLRAIEKATKRTIELMELPSTETINDQRISRFKQRITDTLAVEELGFYYQLIEQYRQEHNVPALEIASALARLLQGDVPFLLSDKPKRPKPGIGDQPPKNKKFPNEDRKKKRVSSGRKGTQPERGMQRFRIKVGRTHDINPGDIVGAIANESQLDGNCIGHIELNDDFSLIDLPEDLPRDIFRSLKTVRVRGNLLGIMPLGGGPGKHPGRQKRGERDPQKNKKFPNQDGQENKAPYSGRKGIQLERGMQRFRINIGRAHRIKPGDIVGAIANESQLDGNYIGHIELNDDFSLIDLPEDLPRDILRSLKTIRVRGNLLGIKPLGGPGKHPGRRKKEEKDPKMRKKRGRSPRKS